MTRQALIFGLMLFIGACQGTRQESVSDAPGADTVSDAQQRPATAPGPAPGTARLRATVQACRQHTADDYRCQVEVREVIAYGAATPVLNVGSEVEVRVPDGGGDRGNERLQETATIEVTLSHAKQPTASGASSSSWTLEAIHAK